jgi:dephospho-CoA kinase
VRLVGLTGGIATGKSTFAAALEALGAPIIDADGLAREVVAPGTPALAAITATFGKQVIASDGTLERKRLAAMVFADPSARGRLEAITHPAIRALMKERVSALERAGQEIAFYDVPLLYEAGLEGDVDCVVLVYAPPDLQRSRMVAAGLSGPEAEQRLAAQLPIDEKVARADVVVVNQGSRADLQAKAAPLLADLRAGLARKLPKGAPKRY